VVNGLSRSLSPLVTGGLAALALTALIVAVVPAASTGARFTSLALSLVLSLLAWATIRQTRGRGRVADGLARANERIVLANDRSAAASSALQFVADTTGVDLACVLVRRGARLAPLAVTGDLSSLPESFAVEGVRYEPGALRDAWRERRSIFTSDGVGRASDQDGSVPPLGAVASALVPVPDAEGATRALLILANATRRRAWPDEERRITRGVALVLGAALQRLHLDHQLHEMRDVLGAVAQAVDPREAYDRAVHAAVRVIPGAEAATLLVRDGEGRYGFVAAEGYEFEQLVAIGDFDEAITLDWYGLGRASFVRGVPRLLRGSEIGPRSYATTHGDEQGEALLDAGRVAEFQATICVPIVAAGEVLGTMNIDNMSLDEAFGEAELELAGAFGQQMGVLFRQTHALEALALAATTDSVTGLANREGFNQRVATELARAARRDEPVHLVMMDLDGFKQVNDRLGHSAGDAVLHRVAAALRSASRTEDGLFRWGGDEFVLLLAGGTKAEARAAADRHVEAIESVTVGGLSMSASVGIASWPDDARDTEDLLRRADDLMYRHKRRDGTPSDDPSADAPRPQSRSASSSEDDVSDDASSDAS